MQTIPNNNFLWSKWYRKNNFFNYFKITKSVNEKIYQKYELNKYINDKNFCDFNYCNKKYRAYFPSELTLPYEYPASLIKEIENDQWIKLPNIIHISFSNTKKYNDGTCDYKDDVWKVMTKRQHINNIDQYHEVRNVVKKIIYDDRKIKIINELLCFLETGIKIKSIFSSSISGGIAIESNSSRSFIPQFEKNGVEISGNKLSTGEWQIFILMAIITDKIMQIKNNDDNPIIFIDQPEDNLNPKMQLNLLRLYKILRHAWFKNIQFFIITHSIYFIGEFVNDDDAIVYNFNNYKPLKYDEKNGLLTSYNINGHTYPSWDEITYLIDQIPTFNVYCNLYEILNHHASKKYKNDIRKEEVKKNGISPCSKCKLKKIKNSINAVEWLIKQKYNKHYEKTNIKCGIKGFRNLRNIFIHRIFDKKEKTEKINLEFNKLKKMIDFLRLVLFEEKENTN